MQFCQPPFQPTPFPNYGQPSGFNNTPNYHQPLHDQINGYSNIIGEGNIVTVITPDGSAQFLFFPTYQWPPCRTYPQYPFTRNTNNPPINTLGAWLVRNIYNPIQATPLYQPHQDLFSIQCPRTSPSGFSLNLAPPGLPLKFHHDKCTSTTDIHYFIPKQLSWLPRRTECVAVQVGRPVANAATACSGEISCAKPCNCSPAQPAQPCNCTEQNKQNHNVKCMCKDSNSKMSIDSVRENRSERKEKRRKSRRNKSKKTHKCECNEPSGSDKGVSTVADQGIDCSPDRGQETQTSCPNSVIIIKASKGACNSMCHRAKVWSPEPCTSKRYTTSHSTVSSQQYMNISDSDTSCSASGTDH